MLDIKDGNMGRVSLLALNPYTVPAGTVGIEDGREVCTEDERIWRWSDGEPLLNCGIFVHIVSV